MDFLLQQVVARAVTKGAAGVTSLGIVVTPARRDREDLWLVCFVEEPEAQGRAQRRHAPADVPRVVELERELEATKTELQGALRNLEVSSEEQMAINEEALSVNEEYQSTNEELLASKEELQSLNEELTALNSQLQETLERQRTTSDDLQNVLYSTRIATIFLDTRFNIRFFTPATKALFNVIPATSGRPLTDLKSLAADEGSARRRPGCSARLKRRSSGKSRARTPPGSSAGSCPTAPATRRTEGVVITYEDVTERRRTAEALTAAKRQAELASIAKTRFLAAASHDLQTAVADPLPASGLAGEEGRRRQGSATGRARR